MKNKILSFNLIIVCLAFMFQSCEDTCSRKYITYDYEPVNLTFEEIKADIQTLGPQELINPGKIYSYGKYIFINEQYEGIHVIDNEDPSNPIFVSFIKIPGNVDMAVKSNILYVDTYTDLLALDITYPEQAIFKKRIEGIKNEFLLDYTNDEGTYTVRYNQIPREVIVSCDEDISGEIVGWNEENVGIVGGPNMTTGAGFSGQQGLGGSMARFTIVDNVLYTIDQYQLNSFDISQADYPVEGSSTTVNWNIETIYPSQGYLFIGSATGMFIYDMESPLSPEYVSSLDHSWACDPVYVYGDYALVTLRSDDNSWCNTVDNQLDIIDISDIYNPTLLNSYQMDNPHGLTIDKDHLFLCEGESGLKVYDLNPLKEGLSPSIYDIEANKTDQVRSFHAYDAIALPGDSDVLMVIGEDGFYQFDYESLSDLKNISIIQAQ